MYCAAKPFWDSSWLKGYIESRRLSTFILKVDGFEWELPYKDKPYNGFRMLGCVLEGQRFSFYLTSHPGLEQAVTNDLKVFKGNVTATLEILGETVQFSMRRSYVPPEDERDNGGAHRYVGVFLHDFAQDGQMAGIVEFEAHIRDSGSKRRRRRQVRRKIELPKFDLPTLLPQGMPT